MDLRTTYLGLELAHPFVPGASPLVDDLDQVRRLEDAGAAAIVMHSLFEEQIAREQLSTYMHTEMHGESHAEALYYFPRPQAFALGPEEYLEQLMRIKQAVSCPVIASLNGYTPGGWLDYARAIEQAGANALELNVYSLSGDLDETAEQIEERTVRMLRHVKSNLRIPVAVKLSPFYTALGHFAWQLDWAGADGLVLFNRLYQPDVDPDTLQAAHRRADLSDPSELPLRLRWLALLSGRLKASLAASGGVHGARDAVKALMCGAHVVQVVSALLRHGPGHLARIREEAVQWMEEHEYHSVGQLRGCMNLQACPDPAVYDRANYMLTLQGVNHR